MSLLGRTQSLLLSNVEIAIRIYAFLLDQFTHSLLIFLITSYTYITNVTLFVDAIHVDAVAHAVDVDQLCFLTIRCCRWSKNNKFLIVLSVMKRIHLTCLNFALESFYLSHVLGYFGMVV